MPSNPAHPTQKNEKQQLRNEKAAAALVDELSENPSQLHVPAGADSGKFSCTASGKIVNLSLEDIKAIAKDIAAAEMT